MSSIPTASISKRSHILLFVSFLSLFITLAEKELAAFGCSLWRYLIYDSVLFGFICIFSSFPYTCRKKSGKISIIVSKEVSRIRSGVFFVGTLEFN